MIKKTHNLVWEDKRKFMRVWEENNSRGNDFKIVLEIGNSLLVTHQRIDITELFLMLANLKFEKGTTK